MNANELILKYAKLGIWIEICADCFAMKIEEGIPNEQQVCWRPIITWYTEDGWLNDDVGCSSDLDKILEDADQTAAIIFEKKYNSVPLDFSKVKKNYYHKDYWHS